MNARLRSWLGSFSARDMALLISLLLLALHAVLLGTAYQRNRAAASLQLQIEDLQANLDQLNEVEQETLAELQSQLAQAEAEIERLEEQLPSESGPYPIYERVYALAQDHDVQLASIARQEPERAPTESGSVAVQIHTVEASGPAQACLDLVGALEADAGPALASGEIVLDPPSESCSFELLTVWLAGETTSSPEQGE